MDNETYELLIEEDSCLPLLESEAQSLKVMQRRFMTSYDQNDGQKNIESWLFCELKSQLPEKSVEDLLGMSKEIVETLTINETNKKSLETAVANGRSKESWFAGKIKNATAQMNNKETIEYLKSLDKAVETANVEMYDTLLTKQAEINMNPNLDGYIAEQHHANTFNLEAELKGSEYRAKVLKPEGNGYNKNSVDIVIVDSKGNTVRRYQSKYCKDSQTTEEAFKKGDYRGQRKLAPVDQNVEKSTNQLEAPDGIKSKPIGKSQVKELQNEAQSGNWKDTNWSDYHTKDLAIGIGKKASFSGLQSAAISAGFDIAGKLYKNEEIKGDELVEKALKSGLDTGIKAASAGALKVCVEKEIIKAIPKGTPAGTIANIAYVGIENVKVIGMVANGELTIAEGLQKMEETTVSTAAGIVASAKGATLGAAIGMVFGPVGAVVGGFIGGSVAYVAGSKLGEVVVKTAQKIREKATSMVKTVVAKSKELLKNGIKNAASLLSSLFCG